MNYPQLNLRLKAAIIDSIIFTTLLFSTAYYSHYFFPDNLSLRLIFVFIPSLSYEPLFLYFTGSSIGHKVNRIMVTHQNSEKKLSLFQCYSRFLIKILLGMFSLLFMFFTKKRQSFHDLITATLVDFAPSKS
jgi:uncharacterized RDD family membrane protein YckC